MIHCLCILRWFFLLLNPPMPNNVKLKLKVNSNSMESEIENGILYLYLLPLCIGGLKYKPLSILRILYMYMCIFVSMFRVD